MLRRVSWGCLVLELAREVAGGGGGRHTFFGDRVAPLGNLSIPLDLFHARPPPFLQQALYDLPLSGLEG